MKKYIKSQDSFGSPVTLNFNRSAGPAHKTFIGGLVSVAILTALLGIFVNEIYLTIMKENTTTKHNDILRSAD